jgi:hypothetical protein
VERLSVELMNPSNVQLADQFNALRSLAEKEPLAVSLIKTIDAIRLKPACVAIERDGKHDLATLRALIGVAIYESGKLPSTSASPSKEAT